MAKPGFTLSAEPGVMADLVDAARSTLSTVYIFEIDEDNDENFIGI